MRLAGTVERGFELKENYFHGMVWPGMGRIESAGMELNGIDRLLTIFSSNYINNLITLGVKKI